MSQMQWRIFWIAAISLAVLLVGVFAFIEPTPPTGPRNVYGFEQFQLKARYSEHSSPGLSLDTLAPEERYRGGVDWSLGGRQYPINVALDYDRRHRLSRIEVSLEAADLDADELETLSELARNYFSSHYAADTMQYRRNAGKELETIEIIGENDNVVTVTFVKEALATIVVAPAS